MFLTTFSCNFDIWNDTVKIDFISKATLHIKS